MKKIRTSSTQLENRVWMLFFQMGYHELNPGHDFTILIERQKGEITRKQIDAFAKDDETVIVAECIASDRMKHRSLQREIEEFTNLKGPISRTIKLHYGSSFKPKILWFFITNNIIWSKPDKQRAESENIQIITDRELRYYLQIADHLRKAARFQFLGQFLEGKKIPEMRGKKLPAIRGKLGGHKFYCFVTTPNDLLKISFVNHRSLNDPSGAPTYQRLVSRTRMRQIGKFISGGGFFSTNLLINFTRPVEFDLIKKDERANITYGYLHLPDRYRSAWIIDGQHRLYGFAPLKEEYLNQNIVAIAFEGMSKGEEANLFVTVNHEQKSVARTLLDDLEGELKWGSDIPAERIGAISAKLIALINDDLGEPFFGRVTQQGIPPTDKTCLTIPALKDGLKRSGLVGRVNLKRKEYEPGPLTGTDDSMTLDRARSALNLFWGVISNSNIAQWELGRQGYLCTNVAIQAYLMLFSSLIRYMEANKGFKARELSPEEIISEVEEYTDPLLKWLNSASAKKMEYFKVPFGSGGLPEYYYRLCKLIKNDISDFQPEGMQRWELEQSDEKIEMADRRIKELNIEVQKIIFDKFKEIYGTEKNAYFEKGIANTEIKTKAYKKSQDDEPDDRLPLENYLDFIDYKMIVEKNWDIFKDIFNIPEPGVNGRTKNMTWMDRLNQLRRIPAHPSETRRYKSEDFDYIDWIYDEFNKRR